MEALTPGCRDRSDPGVNRAEMGVLMKKSRYLSNKTILFMGHFYVVREKLDKTGADDKVRYYGVPVTSGRITTDKLARMVADRCSLTRGDVLAAVCDMSDLILEYLKEGYSVELKDLGDLYLSAGSEGYEDPKDCTPHRVKARRICFRMGARMRKEMQYIKFERRNW